MVSGMDAFKELQIGASADRFLRRGFACLMIDGPGQGTSLTREIWYEPDRYGEVGTSAWEFAAARPEIDPKRIMAWGLSFGSFWATQMAAAEPRYAACAVMYTCFQPHNWPLYEMAAPSFKQRFMYMTGTEREEDFDAVMKKMDVFELSARIAMPYFVMAGEDDSLSDLGCTVEHLNRVPGPKSLVVYAGEEHGMGGSRSSQLGSPFFLMIADWLADRAKGKLVASTYSVVDTNGQIHVEPWGNTEPTSTALPWESSNCARTSPPSDWLDDQRDGNSIHRSAAMQMNEMDKSVTMTTQMDSSEGPVVLVNRFHIPKKDTDAFLAAWQNDSAYMQKQPGYISTQLHRGVAGSEAFLNYAIWESAAAFKAAFTSSGFQQALRKYPSDIEFSPHLFSKIAVAGVCVA